MDNIDVEELIMEIECKSVIWNTALEDYSNKQARKNTWEEIVKFGDLTENGKKELGRLSSFHHSIKKR